MAVLVVLAVSPAAAQATGTISGSVLSGGGPLTHAEPPNAPQSASVTVYTSGEAPVETVFTTAATGAYTTGPLAAGDYKLEFFSSGYVRQYSGGAAKLETAATVHVSDGTSTVYGASLTAYGRLEGKVVDATTGPLSSAVVEVVNAATPEIPEHVYTQPDGTWGASFEDSGTYTVCFVGPSTLPYMPNCSNGQTSRSSAQQFSVSVGSLSTGIDASLVEAGYVSGNVGYGTKLKSDGYTVTVYDSAGHPIGSNETSEAGYAVLAPAGIVKVGFSGGNIGEVPQFYNVAAGLSCANPVTVTFHEYTPPVNANMATPASALRSCPATIEPTLTPPAGTSPAGTTSTTGTNGPGGASQSVSTGATVSSAQISALLQAEIMPSGKAASIRAVLKAGGFVFLFKALEAGNAAVGWYQVPSGAHVARSRPKPVLVAQGQASFAAAGTGTLTVKLTAAGRKLLKHAKHIRLTSKGSFTPTGRTPVTKITTFTLKH